MTNSEHEACAECNEVPYEAVVVYDTEDEQLIYVVRNCDSVELLAAVDELLDHLAWADSWVGFTEPLEPFTGAQ